MRFSKYNLVVEMDWGLLIYNTRQANFIQIHNEEELNRFRILSANSRFDVNDDMVKTLYQKGFIVDDNFDEYEEAKKHIQNCYTFSSKVLHIMLYVTENCNFRCVYCFEQHKNKRFSAENWNALYKYIEKSLKEGKYEYVKIAFFGGEPLLEFDKIIEFLDKLENLKEKYQNVIFQHDMITNGYLLVPKVYNRLISRNVFDYMITLDGFAETHNITRPLVGGGETWDKIVENFKYINNQKDLSKVTVRINLNKDNLKTVNAFISWFYKNFDMEKFKIFPKKVLKLSKNVSESHIITEKEVDEVELITTEIAKTFTSNDFAPLMNLGMTCHCSEKNFYAISTDGKISRCEEAYGDDFCSVGELTCNGDFLFNSNMEKWESNCETEYCKDCIAYPLCAGRKCPKQKFYTGENRGDCSYKQQNPPSDKEMRQKITKYLIDRFYELRK